MTDTDSVMRRCKEFERKYDLRITGRPQSGDSETLAIAKSSYMAAVSEAKESYDRDYAVILENLLRSYQSEYP